MGEQSLLGCQFGKFLFGKRKEISIFCVTIVEIMVESG